MTRTALYVSPSAERAGAERLTKSFILHHSPGRWRGEIFFFKDGPFAEEMREAGVACHIAPPEAAMRLRNPASVARMAREIARVAGGIRADLIHSVMGYGHVAGGLAAMIRGLPAVWFQHGPTGPLDYAIGRIPADTILVNSDFTRRRQLRYRAWTRAISRIHPAVEPPAGDPNAMRERAAKLRNEWFGLPTAKIFGIVGRIASMKGQKLFVEAALRMMRQCPEARFALIGATFDGLEPSYAKEVAALIAKSDEPSRFQRVGFVDDVNSAIFACDAIVSATTCAEPFGLTLLEALQLERPVIAPDEGGPLEIFSEGCGGHFFKARDPEALARAMLKTAEEFLLPDPVNIARAKRQAMETFNVPRMLQELETAYDAACIWAKSGDRQEKCGARQCT